MKVFQYSISPDISTKGEWIQLGQSIDGEGGNSLGAVDISADGKVLVVAAPKYNYNSGITKVYMFDENEEDSNGGTWVQVGEGLVGESSGDYSGQRAGLRISGSGCSIIIGSRKNDGNGNNSGSVRVFSLCS